MKKVFSLALAVVGTAVMLAGCASVPGKRVAATQKVVVLDDKGAAFGIAAPDWINAYISGGNLAVQKLKDYSGLTVFVVESDNASKDYAVG
jgi:uncharacterized protein YcfL